MRPTSDRLRETLFNVIAPRIEGVQFLDLCSGSGAVGIEALSRGAAHVTFVDRSRKMSSLIKSNLELCRIESDEYEVFESEAQDYLRREIGQRRVGWAPWDIVFFDPPYAMDYSPILETLGAKASNLLSENGLLIVEHHHKTSLPEVMEGIRRTRTLKQGDSSLTFYEASSLARE